ncbi:tyrosine-type recombinase/integrase [Bifidobacterium pseudolongum]|uniref:tyrosine-type recombinase/integrase n=1 Tax=Bifidobacterium pseudolongum TaxID=1694 RepID=UPI003BF47458
MTASWRTHVEPRFAYWKINELRHSDIQAFVSELAVVRSASIVNRCLDVLRGICDMAVMDGRIAKNPCEKIKKPRRTTRKEERRYLTIAQLYRLADASGRWRPLVLTLGLTGLRCGEARALQVKDVDFKKHRLRVYKATRRESREWVTKDTKTHARRDVPMPACVEDVLRPLCEDRAPNDLVFVRDDGKPFDEQTASRKVKNVEGKYWWFCALTTSGTTIMTMHELRHTAASIAISAGANVLLVQRMLGHENPAMTLKTYSDLFDEDMNQVRDAIDANVHDALTAFTTHGE